MVLLILLILPSLHVLMFKSLTSCVVTVVFTSQCYADHESTHKMREHR
jgi:hypothetical protein